MGSYFTTQEIKMKLFIAALPPSTQVLYAQPDGPPALTPPPPTIAAQMMSPSPVTRTPCPSSSQSMPSTTRDPSSSVPINLTPPWPMLLTPLIATVSTSLTTRPLLTSPSLTA